MNTHLMWWAIVTAVAYLCLSTVGLNALAVCPAPWDDPNGGYNVTYSPPNQPRWSSGTDIAFYCNRHYTFKTFTLTPVTCDVNGQWKLLGMDPHCYAINCSKPLMVNGSGVVVVGTNYSHGAVIEYRCKTGWSTPEPFAICLGPSWSNKYTPWCSVEKCLDLTQGRNSSAIFYGQVNVVRLGDYDASYPYVQSRVRSYGAEVQYTCDPGTELLTGGNRTCNATGRWTGNEPICFVKEDLCYNVGSFCTKGNSVCCAWGPDGAALLGMACCKPETKAAIGERYTNLSRYCFNDLSDNFLTCMTQLIRCLDGSGETRFRCVYDFILPQYLYGCNRNLGDQPPQQRAITGDDGDLVEFCKRDHRTVACTEFQTSYAGPPMQLKERMCLPNSCVNVTDLQALAESTLKIRCRATTEIGTLSYCPIATVHLNCSDGRSATAARFADGCGTCPPPGGDKSLTECCHFAGQQTGCCLPMVATMLTDRLPSNLSEQCNASFTKALSPCVGFITECLNNLKGTDRDYNCPSYHVCAASKQKSSECPRYYPGSNHSLWCWSTCLYPNDLSRQCQSDQFCLEQTCSATSDLRSLVLSDAKLICDYTKLIGGVSSCDSVMATWVCQDTSGQYSVEVDMTYTDPVRPSPSAAKVAGTIVGGIVGGLVVIAVVTAAVVFFRRKSRIGYTELSKAQKTENSVLLHTVNTDKVTVRSEAFPPVYT